MTYYNCPKCKEEVFTADDLDDVLKGYALGFVCEKCGCDFTLSFDEPHLQIRVPAE